MERTGLAPVTAVGCRHSAWQSGGPAPCRVTSSPLGEPIVVASPQHSVTSTASKVCELEMPLCVWGLASVHAVSGPPSGSLARLEAVHEHVAFLLPGGLGVAARGHAATPVLP